MSFSKIERENGIFEIRKIKVLYEVIDKYLFNGEMPVIETTENGTNDKCLCNNDIVSIVTKEQFKNIEYKESRKLDE